MAEKKSTKKEEKKSPQQQPIEEAGKAKKTTTKKVAAKPTKKAIKKTVKKVVKKTTIPSTAKEKKTETSENKVDNRPSKYYEGVGRRKKAVARVRLFTRGDKDFSVNSKPYVKYFPTKELQQLADGALTKMKVTDKFSVSVLVRGGGIAGQAEAVRHGTARALMKFNADFRKRLKRAGFLTRDPRKKERKKFGLKKARKSPQWAKR